MAKIHSVTCDVQLSMRAQFDMEIGDTATIKDVNELAKADATALMKIAIANAHAHRHGGTLDPNIKTVFVKDYGTVSVGRVVLAFAFPDEQARIRQCLVHGKEIGPAGAFYCAMAEDLLRRADLAAAAGDVIKMIKIYKEMREFDN